MSQPSAISIVWDIVLVLDHEQQQAGRSVRHSAQWGMSLFFDLIFEQDGDYMLEITVVGSRTMTGSNDWYYSSFDIRVESPTPSPTKNGIFVASDNEPSISPSTNVSIHPSL